MMASYLEEQLVSGNLFKGNPTSPYPSLSLCSYHSCLSCLSCLIIRSGMEEPAELFVAARRWYVRFCCALVLLRTVLLVTRPWLHLDLSLCSALFLFSLLSLSLAQCWKPTS